MNAIDYVNHHALLTLALGWLLATIISVMPPFPAKWMENFWIRWLYNVLQIVGASLDKVLEKRGIVVGSQRTEEKQPLPGGGEKTTTTQTDVVASPKLKE